MGFRTRRIHKKVEKVVTSYLSDPPPPLAASLEEYKQQGSEWRTADGPVAEQLREIAGEVGGTFEEFDTGDAAKDCWLADKHRQRLMSQVSWILATPVTAIERQTSYLPPPPPD